MKCFILGPFKVSINSNKERSTAHAQRKLCRAIHLLKTRKKMVSFNYTYTAMSIQFSTQANKHLKV